MKSLVTTNLITIVEDDVLINGLLFPYQTQWNFDRTTTIAFTDCCHPGQPAYVVIVDEVEYIIPSSSAVLCNVINDKYLGQSTYLEKRDSEWPDKEDENMLHPDPCKILDRANRVPDIKPR